MNRSAHSLLRRHTRQKVLLGLLILMLTAPLIRAQPVIAQSTTFQVGTASDATNPFLTFPVEIEEEGGGPGGPPPVAPFPAAMTANFSNITVIPGGGVIGGDVLEFDVTIVNTSPAGSGIVLSAYAFQSKFSESPALASRIGDKLFYGQTVPGSLNSTAASPLGAVKKNGTSNGLFTGKWKGICINSSLDFIPEFNSGLEDESLECAGNRADTNEDGEPELQMGNNMLGLRPGESQVIRLRLDSGTTDGALHVVQPGTLQGSVQGVPVVGPNGVTYFNVQIDNTGIPSPNVVEVVEFGDNKVLRNADGTFNPTFAPAADGLTFSGQKYLTLPRRNFAFSDIIGRNHTCATYGLSCSGNPLLNFLGTGDLVPGVQNFAAILRGYGEFYDPNGDFVPDPNPGGEFAGDTRPSVPYGVLCDNCGGIPYIPIAEFYVDNGDGSVTRQIVGGTYGDPVAQPYLTTIDSLTAQEIKQEIIPEPDPGGPCLQPNPNKPSCAQLNTHARGEFHSLAVVPGAGINGGDAIEFTIDIENNSTNPNAYLTAFNYQTKERGLADIGVLDGFTQDRKDIRVANLTVPGLLPNCSNLNQGACWNTALGIGHFPNVIGNGLLFGQMVWTNANAGREPDPVDSDQVFVSSSGINPTPFWLESVKKNGPFSPILKGNENFICVKSGLFDLDPDSDAACAGQPAILIDPDGEPVPSNISQRLGLPPGQTQSVRIRMEFGDFRGAMLKILAGTLNAGTVDPAYAATNGLARFFDCSDQRELEYCHPHLVGANIGYLPNTNANWLTPQTLEEIEYVIINQPGDAPTVMNFQQNFGVILKMAGFIPSAEFYAPDPNPALVGTPFEGVLIRQQVLGTYTVNDPVAPPAVAPIITSAPVTAGTAGQPYNYTVVASGSPAPAYSLLEAPGGMGINSNGVISWAAPTAGTHTVKVQASNSVGSTTQTFQVVITTAPPTGQAPAITSSPNTIGAVGTPYSYQVTATGNPAPTFSLTTAPNGMTINATSGLISWPTPLAGSHPVTVVATNGTAPDATQSFTVMITTTPLPPTAVLDDFNRANGKLNATKMWVGPGIKNGYRIVNQQVDVLNGGMVFWKKKLGIEQSAGVTLINIDPNGSYGLLLKAQTTKEGAAAIRVSYEPQAGSIIVEAKVTKKKVAVLGSFPVTLNHGDKFGAIAKADGTVEVYVNGQLIGTTVADSLGKKNSSYFATLKGFIGLWFINAGNGWFDDFAGGNGSVMPAEVTGIDEITADEDFDGFEEAWYSTDVEEESVLDEDMSNQLFLPLITK